MAETAWRTIPELVEDAASRFGDREALVEDGTRWSFRDLRDHVREAARALAATGISPGDRIGIWGPNTWEWVVAALGVHLAGAVLVPVNTRFKGGEAAQILDRAGARMLLTVTDFLDCDYVARLGPGRPAAIEEIVVMRGTVPSGSTSWPELIARAEAVDPETATARAEAVSAEDLCHVMFTSGTTGAPKGAMLAHGAICRAYRSWSSVVGLRAGDRYLIVNPFFHAFGLNAGILACLMTGATIVPHPVFDVPSVMKRVPEERITMLPGPPAIYQTILNHPELESFDMSTLRLAVTGAAPVPVELIEQMRSRLGFETIITGYGLTEASGIATMCHEGDSDEKISHTSGRAIEDVEVAVADPDDGSEVPRGQPGEIVIRGYNVMVGYLDDPESTAEAIDAEGWLHTGDIGVMDEDGYLDVTDRLKDMFINGGFNVYPAEVEAQMLGHPDVGQVAVVGVPDPRMGEVGYAFVVPTIGSHPVPDRLIDWCRTEMANYKVPRHLEVVEGLPLNASGKVLKYELRRKATEAVGDDV